VPAYNEPPQMLIETLDALARLDYPDYEVIVVDDGSSDRTVEVAERHASHPRIVRKANGGAPSAFNVGIKAAQGAVLAFLDADDLWHPQKLEIQLGLGAAFVSSTCADFVRRDEVSDAMARKLPTEQAVESISHARLIRKNIIPTSSVLLERRLLEGLKFDERPEYRAVEDFDLWLRIHRRSGPSVKVRQPLVFYRKSASSISKSKLDMLRKNAMLLREHLQGQRFAGLKRAGYLGTYVTHSIFIRLLRRQL